MALYKILRLNKMSCGTKRGLIDMDISLDYYATQNAILLEGISADNSSETSVGIATEHGILSCIRGQHFNVSSDMSLALENNASSLVLTEDQLSIDVDSIDDSVRNAIQLTPYSWLSASYANAEEIEKFNQSNQLVRVIYEFELEKQPNTEACLSSIGTQSSIGYLPLNDILDLCIKSRFKKSLVNSNVPFNLDQPINAAASYDKNVDQYLALDEYPIGFCQCNNDAFMLTKPTLMQPYNLKSDLAQKIYQGDSSLEHRFQLEQEAIETYLYKGPAQYGASSYQEYLSSSSKLVTDEAMISVFTPDRAIKGMKYSYVVNIEQCGSASRAYDNSTIYANGDIYGGFSLTKSMYDALYSVDMPDYDNIVSCRTYCGIQNSQNKVLLKYYDNISYSLSSNDGFADGQATSKLPYQKVEFYTLQRMSSTSKHKSNLFSVKIYDTALDDAFITNKADQSYSSIAQNIKRDIANGVKALAESIAPANTQLFDTYFEQ